MQQEVTTGNGKSAGKLTQCEGLVSSAEQNADDVARRKVGSVCGEEEESHLHKQDGDHRKYDSYHRACVNIHVT